MLEDDFTKALPSGCGLEGLELLAAEAIPNSLACISPYEGFPVDSGRDRMRASGGCESGAKIRRELS